MEELKNLKLTTLVDLLAGHTTEYLKMLKEGTTQAQYNACKEIIAAITAEIESRKQEKADKPEFDPGINSNADRID
jgi:hypothetical protein